MNPEKVRKILVLLLSVLLLAPLLLAQEPGDGETGSEAIRLHVPFRVTSGVYRFKPLNKEDITLFVNDKEREITGFNEYQKSMARTPDLGRSFVLSFSVPEYNRRVADAVSYLSTEVLNYSDMLFVTTPLSVYRVTVSRNKLKMVQDIETLVKKDVEIHKQNRNAAEQVLLSQLRLFDALFMNPYQPPGLFIATSKFLKEFPPGYMKYLQDHLLPDPGKFREVLSFLGTREGERWCIHFQQRDTYGIIVKTKELIRKLRGFFTQPSNNRGPILADLSRFERQLSQIDSYSSAPLADVVMDGNIAFNTIIFGSMNTRNSRDGRLDAISSYIERIYRETATFSGGKAIDTTRPLEGLRSIIDHSDLYYQLAFDYNGTPEPKEIRLQLAGSKTPPAFKRLFSQKEIEVAVRYLSSEKVTLDNIKVKQQRLTFAITSFKLQEQEGVESFGILRVRIRLLNQYGEREFTSERVLRASAKELVVKVTHDFPEEYSGQYLLSIEVTDLIRNSASTIVRDIELK